MNSFFGFSVGELSTIIGIVALFYRWLVVPVQKDIKEGEARTRDIAAIRAQLAPKGRETLRQEVERTIRLAEEAMLTATRLHDEIRTLTDATSARIDQLEERLEAAVIALPCVARVNKDGRITLTKQGRDELSHQVAVDELTATMERYRDGTP